MKKIIACVLCCMLLTACFFKFEYEVGTSSTKSEEKPLITEKTEVINAKDISTEGLGIYKQNSHMYMGIGSETKVTIYTDAQRDTDGIIMWDDSQSFALIAEINGKTFELVEKNMISLGTIEYMAYEDMETGNFHILCKKMAGAGLILTDFEYDKETEQIGRVQV